MNFTIRKVKNSNEDQILRLIKKNLLEVNIKDYPKKVIFDLCKQYNKKWIKQVSKCSDFFIFFVDNKIAGIGRFQKGFIYDVFVSKKLHGKGLGTKIINHLEKIALKKRYKKVKIPASKTALPFYKKLNYKISNNKLNSKTAILMEKNLK